MGKYPMMQIYKIAILALSKCLLLACPLWAGQQADLESFFYQRGGSAEILQQYLHSSEKNNTVIQTASHIISLSISHLSNTNPINENILKKSIAVQSRHELCRYIFNKAENIPMKNRDAIFHVYMKESQVHEKFRIYGIEFIIRKLGDSIICISSISYQEIKKIVYNCSNSNQLMLKYCEKLFSYAENYFRNNKIDETIIILKELSDLNWSNIEFDIINIEILIVQNKYEEAEKWAIKIIQNNFYSLNADLSEKLGDIFMHLGDDLHAKQCYDLALEINSNIL